MKSNIVLFSLIFLTQALLINELPLWASLSAAGFWLWRILAQQFRIQPQRWLTGLFSIVFLVITLLWYRTAFDKDVATTYLLVLSSLKILEYQEENEKEFIILLGLFLSISKFLFTFDLIYTFTGVSLIFAFLYQLFPESWQSKKISFKFLYLGKISLYALPFAAFLFFTFPRIQTAGFSGLYGISNVGQSGFSDDLKPGSISEVVKSGEIAFRAEFYSMVPVSENLYWRGQVLNEVEGFHWKRSRLYEESEMVNDHISQYDYKIILEPHYNRWLFSYDPSSSISLNTNRVFKNENKNIFYSFETIQSRISYEGKIKRKSSKKKDTQNKETHFKFAKDIERYKNDPELMAILEPLKGATRQITVNNLLQYYVKNNFKYTLSPGAEELEQNQSMLSYFLFKSKKGFCEHYASASGILLQLLGIPSQVIIGYQGGEFNEVGRFFSIAQKDAHAWVEYLNEQQEWVRLDPTQVVAPDRLRLGAASFEQNSAEGNNLFGGLKESIRKTLIIDQTIAFASLANYKWNTFLLDFNRDQQNELLDLAKTLFVQIIAALFTIAVLFFLIQLYRSRRIFNRKKDRMAFEFEQKMKKLNLQRQAHEGPLEWFTRIHNETQTNPNNKKLIEIFQDFIKMYFAKTTDLSKEDLQSFRKKLKHL